jgi:hypothetical protein
VNVDTSEFRALTDEITGLRGEVAALTRLACVFYHAGHDDALHGHTQAAAAPPARKPRRARSRHLKVVQL